MSVYVRAGLPISSDPMISADGMLCDQANLGTGRSVKNGRSMRETIRFVVILNQRYRITRVLVGGGEAVRLDFKMVVAYCS